MVKREAIFIIIALPTRRFKTILILYFLPNSAFYLQFRIPVPYSGSAFYPYPNVLRLYRKNTIHPSSVNTCIAGEKKQSIYCVHPNKVQKKTELRVLTLICVQY